MRVAVAALALLAPAALAGDWRPMRPAAAPGAAYPECFCTNRGQRVEIGETACLRISGRRFTALCEMSLNNPAWRRLRDECAPEALSRASPPAPPASARRDRG